ncbi:hypothetical protein TRFO_15897 [Tritrichomonas foetus]|uniref:Protein kinase domain-containing protein n=1 Tax=Tritrichomonas foetus TaxID=1144522 RepID=A0A1J4KRF8_9EUKA|nr:hypothetical protein TRFO_15897 [Tritrichomonas foetus]|eukprot:OHT13873.1 hypothetical protein TRFO_15897 [Tritrichomonas foetus]
MKHPSIVKMKGFSFKNFENEDYITIVMELMKHGSLQNILEKEQKGQFDFDYNNTHRQIIITGITFGMKFLHSYNIFHRDLKPGNILLDPELHPKIADFGSSKFSDPKHAYTQTQRYGTLFYMSPESHIDNHYGLESDVYSFGIMLFEILTAKPAYDMTKPEINSSLKFMNKVSYQHYRPQFQVPIKEVFMDLIQQCWDFEPSNRPTFAEIYEKLSSDENYILGDVDRYVFSNFLHELEQWEANESNFVIRNEETDIKLLIENEILRQKEEFLIKQVNSQATSS